MDRYYNYNNLVNKDVIPDDCTEFSCVNKNLTQLPQLPHLKKLIGLEINIEHIGGESLEELEFGSGYMSDERTQKFLEENHSDQRFEKIFRKSWIPYQNHKLKQRNIMDFEK